MKNTLTDKIALNNITPQEIQIIQILRNIKRGETITFKINDDNHNELLMTSTLVLKEVVEVESKLSQI